MYVYLCVHKENTDTSFSLLSTILLTYNLPFSFILWGRKKGEKTQNACYGKKEIIIFSHSFILFLFLLPSLLYRARPVQLRFLQVTNCWSCCFSFLFLLLLLLRFLFSVCALLPLLINFDSLSTLQEITHPLSAHSGNSPGPSSPFSLPSSPTAFLTVFFHHFASASLLIPNTIPIAIALRFILLLGEFISFLLSRFLPFSLSISLFLSAFFYREAESWGQLQRQPVNAPTNERFKLLPTNLLPLKELLERACVQARCQ